MTQKSVQKNNRNAIKQPTANQPSLTHYQGPIPPPDILQGLDDLVPGTAAKLIQLALDESEHRRSLEIKVANANISAQQQQSEINLRQTKAVFRSDILGQIFGFLVCITSISLSGYLGYQNHETLAFAIAAIPTAAIIKAFIIKK
ncbi:MAG: DUF2335 domain-containing protein [Methylococcales bacterium]|nr:DUF2335 domain-containing protein [Methylococcales bacterium]